VPGLRGSRSRRLRRAGTQGSSWEHLLERLEVQGGKHVSYRWADACSGAGGRGAAPCDGRGALAGMTIDGPPAFQC
jgi:hypothetical protein